MMISRLKRAVLFLRNLYCRQFEITMLMVLAFGVSANAYALERTHEYIVYVVNKAGEPISDISIETRSVRGYDQSSASCVTSISGRCSLKFSAFAPSGTSVSVILESKNKQTGYSPIFTLPPVKNSFFKNDDSIEAKIVFDEEGAMAEKRAEAEKAMAQKKAIEELVNLEKGAIYVCADKESCEKAFALTEIFFSKASDMKIQTATGTTIETYNPTEGGKIGLRALKIPGKGSSASIKLIATCKEVNMDSPDICIRKKSDIYREFRPFIENAIKE